MALPSSAVQNPSHFSLFNEASLYHPVDRSGFFALLCKGDGSGQLSYPLKALPEVVRHISPQFDTYISQGEFFRKNRRVVNLAHIGLSFLDLDTYRSRHADLSSDHMVREILFHCADHGILQPSVILFSGRGYYVKWLYEKPVPRGALPRWNALQSALIKLFADFGADPQARDASRVLRLEGTVNTKSGKICRVVWPDRWQEPTRYDFEVFCDDTLPFTRLELRELREGRAAKKLLQEEQRRLKGTAFKPSPGKGTTQNLKPFDPVQLSWDRLEDLRLLAKLRGGVTEGMRDQFLFLGTCALAHVVDPKVLKLEIHTLAKEFAPGLSMAEVVSYTSAAIRRAEMAFRSSKVIYDDEATDIRYFFKNDTLIDRLEITPAEQRDLKTIISKDEKRRRDAIRKEQGRLAEGAMPRSVYRARAEYNRDQARILQAQGVKVKDIAAILNLSASSIEKYLKKPSLLEQ